MNEEERSVQDFKTATGIAQSLSKTSSDVASRDMLVELKNIKTRLTNVKTNCNERLNTVKPVAQQVESLETSLKDLDDWLTEGENLINSQYIDGNIDLVGERLKKHRVCNISCYITCKTCFFYARSRI